MSEQKIANTFDKMRETIDQYSSVVRENGALWRSIDELGGDPAWLNDIKTALDAVYSAIDEADMGARAHLDSQEESADISEAPQGQELRFNSGPIKGSSTGMNLSRSTPTGAPQGQELRFNSGPIKGSSTGMNLSKKSSNPMASTGAARRFRDPKFEGSEDDNNMFMGAIGTPYPEEDNPVKDAIMQRLSVKYNMADLLTQYGLDRVEAAIDDVASFHDDAEELGSSDISIMVKQVMDNLGATNEGLDYLKKLAGI
jgi:hypothetical protein